jgi:hypothetical protein
LLAKPAVVVRRVAGPLAAILAIVGSASPAPAQERVNPRGAAIKAYLDRVNQYVALTKKLDEGLSPSPTKDPEKIEARRDALAVRIRRARQDAKRGDIFGDVEYYVREAVRRDAEERSRKDKAAAMEEVPPYDPPRVNAVYPTRAPLATMPPLLLADLPRLPDGLEYRFMGRDLVLRDVKSNLIVDFVNGAVPASKR